MTSLTGYLARDYDVLIGIDVDKSSFSFTAKDHYAMSKSKKIPADPENLFNYIKKTYQGKRVLCAYEAGPTGFGLYDYMKEHDVPCLIVSPGSIPKPPNERVKTNRIDSVKIVQHLKSGQLRPIRVPTESYRQLRHLAKIQQNYSNIRKTAKQRIKALLLYENLYPLIEDNHQRWSNSYIDKLKNAPSSEAVRQRLDMLLADLEYSRRQILSIQKTLRIFCKKHSGINKYMTYLLSVPGIGFIIAVALLAAIGDPKNLKNPREIASFIGLTPAERSTGDTVTKGSITHLGDKRLRSLLVEAAWQAIRKDTPLAQFFYRIKGRHHHKIGSRKAIVAVARKLTHIIYRVLKDERRYIAR